MVIKGIYDGDKVILLDSISLPANTSVQVYVPDQTDTHEMAYWQKLLDMGVIKRVVSPPEGEFLFTPITVKGKPVSEVIIEERRYGSY